MTLNKALSSDGASPVAFRLDPASGVPTYLQLVQQVEQALRLGYLKPRRPAAEGARGGRRPRDQPEHGPQGLPRAGAQGTRLGPTRAGARSSTARSARSRCPSSPSSAGACVPGSAGQTRPGSTTTAIVALVTSTLRDFSERRDGRTCRGDPARSGELPEGNGMSVVETAGSAAATAARGHCATARWPSRRGV